jgi:U6 snRNA-associated Sm-like protein LSm8
VYVLTSDGRVLTGTLVGSDQVQNLVLNDAVERVYAPPPPPPSSAEGGGEGGEEEGGAVEEVELGLYVVRGDSLCLVGEYDPDALRSVVRADPIPCLQQQQQSV